MTRFLAAIMLFVWTACYVRCATEISGQGRETVDACCKHEQPAQGTAPEDGTLCGICDAIISGGLLFSPSGLLAAFILSVVALGILAMPVLMARLLRMMALARIKSPPRVADPPWREPRLWEFLARTACPVRGPALMLA